MQFVFDGGASDESELLLKLLSDGVDCFLLAVDALRRLKVLLVPALIEPWVNLLLREKQRPQPVSGLLE